MTAAADDEVDLGEYDYIVAGAGSAGCLLANRLSADPGARVLVVEAGGRDDWIWLHIPAGYLFAMGDPRADWMFSTEPQAGLGGRALAYPRGKVIGGSSAINAMIYMRGQAADYDGWRQLGLAGWGWEEVLPFFLRHEDHFEPGLAHRGGGEWRVERGRVHWPILDAIRDACEAAGFPKVADFNGGDNAGSSYFQVNQKRGVRWSAATAFLKPVLKRRNLRLETGVEVERVLFDGRRATGLAMTRQGRRLKASARREVVLAAGAIGSPKILELSGVGAPERLRRAGVQPIHALPGVGENLQDHLQLRPVYKVSGAATLNSQYANLLRRALIGLEYAALRTGPLTMAPSQLGLFARSDPRFETPNLQFHFQPLSLDNWGEGLHPFDAFTASVCNLRPTSRGYVHVAGPDPAQPPRISPNYLQTEEDRAVAVSAIRLARRIVDQPPLARFQPREHRPGPDLQTDSQLSEAASQIGGTIFHPVGTAAMGADDDPAAVLDARLRVRGLAGLRVCDASAMPRITSGNTNSPVLMIAEKGAAMILEDAG